MPSLEAMSTETLVSPAAETQKTAADTQNQPEVVNQEAEAIAERDDPSDPQDEGTDESDKTLKRLQRRIDKRTADVYRERAEKEQLRARLAELEAKSGEQEKPQDSKQDPVAIAKEIAKAERFAERANDLVEQGNKKHKDYMQALTALAAEVGPFVAKNGHPSPFMEAVLEVADKPTELLYHLGKNPEIAEELAGLSPLKLAKRLDRIERELADAGKTKPSSAPKPLQEIRGSVSTSKALADLDEKEFAKRRREQIANRK
jgi:hypothetical protein